MQTLNVRWHGFNNDGYHGVALQNTVKDYLESLPIDTTVNAYELETLIQRAVDAFIAHQPDPTQYDRDLRYEHGYEEGGVERVIEACYTNKHHYNHPHELVERVGEGTYRRIEAISEEEYNLTQGL
jgi:hypothetical protein